MTHAPAPAFYAGMHQATRSPLDNEGIDARGVQHRFGTPSELEAGTREVAGRLHAITEHVGEQLARLDVAGSAQERAELTLDAAAKIREAHQAVLAPVEALERAEVLAALDALTAGWEQVDEAERVELLKDVTDPPQLIPGVWVNERAAHREVPIALVYETVSPLGVSIRDVVWPSGFYPASSWRLVDTKPAPRWRKPPKI
ncbi:hypothetical protein C5B85_00095 [Pseudoclavibacter sp. AY1F1]|uniref:hypothetical protein n=1 Tax=Pseudoclavibacter sp. AY1F1 TaxID=2080583 RepID=UPI000CE88921|nr:hypothetical protein [Pseudoclavibacter sp. AY1F1]PPF46735.1 hypothetical protein C5B85_00095 [Pseudoclavibacter sp. AY1F1]